MFGINPLNVNETVLYCSGRDVFRLDKDKLQLANMVCDGRIGWAMEVSVQGMHVRTYKRLIDHNLRT